MRRERQERHGGGDLFACLVTGGAMAALWVVATVLAITATTACMFALQAVPAAVLSGVRWR